VSCGIGGVIKENGFDVFEAFDCLGLFYSLSNRGVDAWGYTNGEVMEKSPGSILEISDKTEARIMGELTGKNIFLCHTRHATRGSPVENSNNHPFLLGNFVMAHNGYFSGAVNQKQIEKRSGIHTDSFWLLWHIYEEFKTTRDVFKSIERAVDRIFGGTMAVWLLDLRDLSTYIFRAEKPGTPLHYAELRDRVVFASEEDHVKIYLENLDPQSTGDFRIVSLSGGKILKIRNGKIVKKKNVENLKSFGGFGFVFSSDRWKTLYRTQSNFRVR